MIKKRLKLFIMPAVLAIYAKENGRGMVFEENEEDNTPPPAETSPAASAKPMVKSRPNLKVVK